MQAKREKYTPMNWLLFNLHISPFLISVPSEVTQQVDISYVLKKKIKQIYK